MAKAKSTLGESLSKSPADIAGRKTTNACRCTGISFSQHSSEAKDLTAIAAIEGVAKRCPTEALGTLELKMGLTEAYKRTGRWEDAEVSARDAVRVANTHSKRGLGFICRAEQSLAILLIDRRKNLDEARRLLEASRAEYLTVFGPNNNVSVQRLTKRLDDLAKLRAGKSAMRSAASPQ